MAFPGNIYTPPGVYIRTLFENPTQALLQGLRLPVFIGTGSEVLTENDLEVIRGSSTSVDTRIIQEDVTGRSVISVSQAGAVTLGSFDGERDRIQVKNFPIVDGNGTGTVATNTASVVVTINGSPIVVLKIDGAKGILKLSTPPKLGDEVRVSYFYRRTDTRITDDVSDQVTEDVATILGAKGQSYEIVAGFNDTFIVTVDDDNATYTVTLPPSSPGSPWSASQIAAFINTGTAGSSLVASTFVNNFGQTAVRLVADRDIRVGAGTSNSTLGFTANDSTARRRVFHTFQGPIVDGTDGGVTSTDPSDVVVKVDGVQVLPTAVDGHSRSVTLPFAPEPGAEVTIQYFFNSWQDTFDYLAKINVTEVLRAGTTPDRQDFFAGADFVLKDDRIIWGTAAITEAGAHTAGTTLFNDAQISTTLVDARQFLAPCAPVTNTSVSPPVTSTKEFRLPLAPTTGNGRDTPLGSDTFSSVTNGRVDLPTNRPDLVIAYWGFGIQDALERGPVKVLRVESSTSTITLQDPVPVGAEVFASFYYNTLTDQSYTFTVVTPGASGVGTYTIRDEDGGFLLTPQFGSKGAALTGITLQFPSGSERTPDVRFETPFDASAFTGPVEENVSVTFANKDSTLAKFSVEGSELYSPIEGSSDRIRIQVDGADLTTGASGLLLSNVQGTAAGVLGFHATMVGSEVQYDAASGLTTYAVTPANNSLNLTLDGVLVQAQAEVGTANVSVYADAINRAVLGETGAAVAAAATTITLAATASALDDLYNGWTIEITSGLAAGDVRTIEDYDGGTQIATVDAAFSAAVAPADTYFIYNEAHLPRYVAASRFSSAVTIAAGEYDTLTLHYTGNVTLASGALVATVAPGTYNSATQLAVAVQSAINTALAAEDFQVRVEASANSELVFKLIKDPADASGVLEFLSAAAPADDFAILAGIDTSANPAEGQTKLVYGPVARRYSVAGDNTSALQHDRLILRNRLVPGSNAVAPQHVLAQAYIRVEGSSGATETGLAVTETRRAGWKATVLPATLLGTAGFADGQATGFADARDSQPVVTLYADGGTNPQNNEFQFSFDGVPVTVQFTDAAGVAIPAAGTADVPVGPGSVANTILNQIASAMAAAGLGATPAAVLAAGLVRQEGAGIRFTSALSNTSSRISIGNASANGVLGFVAGAVAERTLVSADTIASALMADNGGGAFAATDLLGWATPLAGRFPAEALATVITDAANAKYLFVQSAPTASVDLGVSSSIVWRDATTSSVLLPGVGLVVSDGEGASGEAGVSGFYVTSSDPISGSGTVNNSLLNSGVGQDGLVGQTYRDLVTGLTFTVLGREGGGNYPDGSTFTFQVRQIVTTDSNLPVNTVPGLEVVVSNTLGIGADDTAIVSTYERGGQQPANGDSYFVSYNYSKQDFSTRLFTKFSAVQAEYGANSPDNPVTLAAYLAILNGAVLVGVKQVQKDVDEDADGVGDSASTLAFINAVDDLEGALPGGILPNILVPLDVPTADTAEFFQYLARHCDIQSLIRNRAERTAVCGFPAGTLPRAAGDIAESVRRSRLRVVYPDIATLTLENADATSDQFIVSGPFLVAGMVGSLVTPTVDVATPWTSRRFFGFDGLARTLDATTQNQVAVRGVTILEDRPPAIRIRQGFTTDMSNILTKLPTITQIADEVQQQSRATLDRFIGIKFLPGILSQIEGQLSTTLRLLVSAEILTTYTGVKANVAADDPTVAEIEAYYQPVFPLLYIVVSFNLRSTL